ncbi:hypothetical protein GCM10007886_18730 [Methylobacterium gregans]|nr:hypothetical protein GCM10007886_18730 [Methylobacterium gregans]
MADRDDRHGEVGERERRGVEVDEVGADLAREPGEGGGSGADLLRPPGRPVEGQPGRQDPRAGGGGGASKVLE